MKKKIISTVIIMLMASGILYAAWEFVKMNFATSVHYTEQDRIKYLYYTPELLKKFPRVSDDYSFSFANIMGPSILIYSIQFNNTTDLTPVRAFLQTEGYKPAESCITESECWISSSGNTEVSFYSSSKLNFIEIDLEEIKQESVPARKTKRQQICSRF